MLLHASMAVVALPYASDGRAERGLAMGITRRGLLRAGLALPALLAACGRATTTEDIQTSFFCFDTVCAIGGVMEQELLDAAEERCHEFEELLSRTLPQSDVSRINAAGGEAVEVDPRTADLIGQALTYCSASDGLFDITIGAVSSLWDFHEGVVPTPEQIAAALPHVGYACVRVSGTTVQLADPEARIDLGGIAKGYTGDRVGEVFSRYKISSGIISLGGNVQAFGSKLNGKPWRVAVQNPESSLEYLGVLDVENKAVVTSGGYERYFEENGVRYHHIIDPRTGYPADSGLISATIVCDQGILADGLSTSLFIMGKDQAEKFWRESSWNFDYILEDKEGTLYVTEGIADSLTTDANVVIVNRYVEETDNEKK